jgi:hypothetical protein
MARACWKVAAQNGQVNESGRENLFGWLARRFTIHELSVNHIIVICQTGSSARSSRSRRKSSLPTILVAAQNGACRGAVIPAPVAAQQK